MAITMTRTQRSVVATGSDTTNLNKFLELDVADTATSKLADTNVKVVRFIIEAKDGSTSRVVKIAHEETDGSDVIIFNRAVTATDQFILDRNAGGFGEWMKNPKVSIAGGTDDITVQMIYE